VRRNDDSLQRNRLFIRPVIYHSVFPVHRFGNILQLFAKSVSQFRQVQFSLVMNGNAHNCCFISATKIMKCG
jgi:hypothetical protein